MKKAIIIITIVALFIITVLNIEQTTINIHVVEDAHIVTMYNSWYDALLNIRPIKSIKLPIVNGNYIGNPDNITFAKWLAHVVVEGEKELDIIKFYDYVTNNRLTPSCTLR